MPKRSGRSHIARVGLSGGPARWRHLYEERGPAVIKARAHRRAAKMLRELRVLGYRVDLAPATVGNA